MQGLLEGYRICPNVPCIESANRRLKKLPDLLPVYIIQADAGPGKTFRICHNIPCIKSANLRLKNCQIYCPYLIRADARLVKGYRICPNVPGIESANLRLKKLQSYFFQQSSTLEIHFKRRLGLADFPYL
jgi:hypothetical protein